MLSRASTTRHRLNPRLVGSGRHWTVRAKAPEDPGRDRSPGIPGVGGTKFTPPERRPSRLPRSSSTASTCSPSSGAAPPPSGSRRPGCGTGSHGSGRNRSAWRPGTPPPSGFAPAGWVNPAGAFPQGSPPFQPERMPCCGGTEQESGPGPRHLVLEGALASLPGRVCRVPVAYGRVRDRGARHPCALALIHRFHLLVRDPVVHNPGLRGSPDHHPPPGGHRRYGPPGPPVVVAARGLPPFPGCSAMRGTSFVPAIPRRRESGRQL